MVLFLWALKLGKALFGRRFYLSSMHSTASLSKMAFQQIKNAFQKALQLIKTISEKPATKLNHLPKNAQAK